MWDPQTPCNRPADPPSLIWLRYLPKAERQQFRLEANTLRKKGDEAGLKQLLIEWKATAEIYADPALFAELRTPEDDIDL